MKYAKEMCVVSSSEGEAINNLGENYTSTSGWNGDTTDKVFSSLSFCSLSYLNINILIYLSMFC